MHHHAHRRLSSWWPLPLAAALAVAPGCSVEPEPQEDLVPFWDSRGLMSFRYVPRNQPASEAETAASAAARDVWLRQQELEEAKDRRQQALLAYQERRREIEEEWRRKQEQEEAERVAYWQGRQEWHQREQDRRQARQERQSRQFEDRRRSGQAEAEQWQRASQPFILQDQR